MLLRFCRPCCYLTIVRSFGWMDGSAADGMRDMQNMAQPAPMGQPPDMSKIFQSEKESLELTVHHWDLDKVEERILNKYRHAKMTATGVGEKKLQ